MPTFMGVPSTLNTAGLMQDCTARILKKAKGNENFMR